MTHTKLAYIHADKAIGHYCRLLAGRGLTRADKRMFRLLLIKAVFARSAARARLETMEEVIDEMVAA